MSELEIQVLRTLPDALCNEKEVCPGRIKIKGVAGSFVVLKQVTDPAHAAALARHVATDELLGWTPDELFDPYEEV